MSAEPIPLHVIPVLEALARCEGSISFHDLKGESKLAQATLNRILNTLCSHNYALKIGHGKYMAGPRLIRMGMAVGRNQVVPHFKPVLRGLVERTLLNAELYMIAAGGPIYFTHYPAPREANVSFSFRHVIHDRKTHPAGKFYLAIHASESIEGYRENFIVDRGGQWPELFRAASMIKGSPYCLALSGMLTNVPVERHAELKSILHEACITTELPGSAK